MEIIVELGCGMVGNVGLIEVEVVLIFCKLDEDEVCWVYFDIGKFYGFVEIMDEVIWYLICMLKDGDVIVLCVFVGLICDSVDVFYEKILYELFISLLIGDKVLIEVCGVYMIIYFLVGFNGFVFLVFFVI